MTRAIGGWVALHSLLLVQLLHPRQFHRGGNYSEVALLSQKHHDSEIGTWLLSVTPSQGPWNHLPNVLPPTRSISVDQGLKAP